MTEIPYPPKSALNQEHVQVLRHLVAILDDSQATCERAVIDAWTEKVVRLVEFNRRQLKDTFRTRFDDQDIASVIVTLLIRRGWPLSGAGSKKFFALPDVRCLNAALWIKDDAKALASDAALGPACDELTRIMSALPTELKNRGTQNWCEGLVPPPDYSIARSDSANAHSNATVVLLSPNFRSLNSIATLHQLAKLNINVTDIIVRKLGSFRRLKEELGFSPAFLIKRVVNELILPRLRRSKSDSANLSAYLNAIDCQERSVEQLAARLGNIRVHYFSNFNDQDCVDTVKSIQPDYGVFTGGGIIRPALLSQFRHGIAHAHPGILPQYKGMDVVQWAILEGSYDFVGSSCQIMSPALDAGSLFGCQNIDIKKFASLNQVRTAVVEDKVDLICNKLHELLAGKIATIPHPDGGRQYFLMHPELCNIVAWMLGENLHRQDSLPA